MPSMPFPYDATVPLPRPIAPESFLDGIRISPEDLADAVYPDNTPVKQKRTDELTEDERQELYDEFADDIAAYFGSAPSTWIDDHLDDYPVAQHRAEFEGIQ